MAPIESGLQATLYSSFGAFAADLFEPVRRRRSKRFHHSEVVVRFDLHKTPEVWSTHSAVTFGKGNKVTIT